MAIKLLSKQVINQISAGEVVEKPASIVKELVENSIDAGATNISIEIKSGGIDYICVSDNGHGIKKDEVKLAFTPHATSKLENIEDLNSLVTMGFRGEALATISAVSKVTMITKTAEQDTGICVNLEGGEEVNSFEIAAITGTKIEVKNIFFNTPARLKFLRKPKSEENDITNYVEKLMLANHDISFKYIVDGKIIYNTTSGSMHNNLYAIYGKELAENMLEVNYINSDYSVTGYISKPMYSKPNRSYQTLFVNNRFCNNSVISSAVSNAYENFSMKGKFPVYVLFLSLPQNEVDVNVHPNKLEVKFEDSRKVYMLFNNAIFETLSNYNHVKTLDEEDDENTQNLPLLDQNNLPTLNELNNNEGISGQQENKLNNILEDYASTIHSSKTNSGTYGVNLTDNILPQEILSSNQTSTFNMQEIRLESTKAISIENDTKPISENIVQEDFKDILNLNYVLIGKAFNTYLIIEYDDKLFLIDQHAAHERQNYDEILKQLETNTLKIQDLLIPYTLKVSNQESLFIGDNLTQLKEFGIDICEFGYNTYKVSSVPLIISNINLKDFFAEIFNNLNSLAKSPKDVIKNRFMQMACKSAVKGGDNLSDFEIKTLLNTLKESTDILLCPHGRPIVVEITKKQIEKWFKRIV